MQFHCSPKFEVASLARLVVGAFLVLAILPADLVVSADDAPGKQASHLNRIQELAGDNASELMAALEKVPEAQQPGLVFLLENMPEDDLQSLSAEFLLNHLQVGYLARHEAKWGKQIPEDIFLNNVLPYANVNESRDDVRRQLREQFWPVIKDLDSISVAAATLNREVFRQLNVKYSTKRRRADQGPAETMESGIASCTGLSILLIDACRACGIPARFAGTPLWKNLSGNHSWVEIWDSGWHFTGAAEPTGDELDKGWFVGRAAQATMDDPRHGIYAVSFKQTDLRFPLVWARRGGKRPEVYAVNVTDRYAKPQKQLATDLLELQFRAFGGSTQDRCRANLVVRKPSGEVVFRGQTYDESHDANDHLTAKLKPGKYEVELKTDAGLVIKQIEATESKLVTLRQTAQAESPESVAPNAASPVDQLNQALKETPVDFKALAEATYASAPLSKEQSGVAKELLIEAYQASIRENRKAEHTKKLIILGDKEMPYDFKVFGEAPEDGHSLYISMHGGGGAPKRVNDSQWRNQIRLYKLEEGIYIAPRAPTDTWNLWHQGHIDPMFTRLIANFIAFENVNPNRVYLTGYSAGGDGVFQLAPRMADQLAAAAMMAGHPNETRPDGLLNLPFTLHMGGDDRAYSRNAKAQEWKEMLAKLEAENEGGYKHWVKIHEGKPHWMGGQDAAGVEWMAQFTRNLTPKRVIWLQDDVLHDRFYWLALPSGQAKPRQRIEAKYDGQNFEIVEAQCDKLELLLNDEMLDLDASIKVTKDGKTILEAKPQRTIGTLIRTLVDRGDPSAMFSASMEVELPASED